MKSQTAKLLLENIVEKSNLIAQGAQLLEDNERLNEGVPNGCAVTLFDVNAMLDSEVGQDSNGLNITLNFDSLEPQDQEKVVRLFKYLVGKQAQKLLEKLL
jgi:hypothetical protein